MRQGVCVDEGVSGIVSVSERLSVDACGWDQMCYCLDEAV